MTLNIGKMRHQLTVQTMTSVPDGDGGFTETWTDLDPPNPFASIERATQRSLERLVANVTIGQASHVVRMRYHPDVTLDCRILWTDRAGAEHTANVVDVNDMDGAGVELTLLVSELVS